MNAETLNFQISKAGAVHSRKRIWRYYLHRVTDGVCLEFGVWRGHSINTMARRRPQAHFHGFDSFDGLPEAWKNHEPGHFSTDTEGLVFLPNVTIHRGLFADTMPEFVLEFSGKLQAVHIDCDLGSSTETVLRHLTPFLLATKPAILFDEFYNYRGYEAHEFGAFLDWINATGCAYTVEYRNAKHQQVLIQLR